MTMIVQVFGLRLFHVHEGASIWSETFYEHEGASIWSETLS